MGKYKICFAGLLIVLLMILLAVGLLSSENHVYRWVFVYYMSYDNDLNVHGSRILSELEKGIINDEIAVVTQADFNDIKCMKRIAMYNSGGKTKRKELSVKSENSADANELKKYFDWVRSNWKAENYCIVLLNHGGALDDMCKDERPFGEAKKNNKLIMAKWLSGIEAAKIIADFNRSVDNKVRLLFLQQCARGSIQNLYSFTDTCQYLMASPAKVGAPNTYYARTLQAAAKGPDITGKNIAQNIMLRDKDYTLYILFDCNELKKLPEKLKPVLDSFVKPENLKWPKECKPLFRYEDEEYYDLKSYFQSLSRTNGDICDKELNAFFDWIDNELIVTRRLNDKSFDKSWQSGLSIYVPSDPSQLDRYDFLPIYKQTNLENLMRLTFQ
ncbi:MAG: hypothetical protein JW787_14145 [Sedimentisphaerales bacterium]|nr:hypothetical protein [Sedimentisphaerales bacterium]